MDAENGKIFTASKQIIWIEDLENIKGTLKDSGYSDKDIVVLERFSYGSFGHTLYVLTNGMIITEEFSWKVYENYDDYLGQMKRNATEHVDIGLSVLIEVLKTNENYKKEIIRPYDLKNIKILIRNTHRFKTSERVELTKQLCIIEKFKYIVANCTLYILTNNMLAIVSEKIGWRIYDNYADCKDKMFGLIYINKKINNTFLNRDLSYNEQTCLLYLENVSVECGGKLAPARMNEEDWEFMKKWKAEGVIDYGRIKAKDIEPSEFPATNWVTLSEDAWIVAHRYRKIRYVRKDSNRTWKKTSEK